MSTSFNSPVAEATQISSTALAAALIRVGQQGIAPGDDRIVDAYFAPDFVFHSPGGEMTLAQLKAFWSSMRAALTGFTITRKQIIVEGNLAAARNLFSGTFEHEFTASPLGTLPPTGQPVAFEVINTFRYDAAGLLIRHGDNASAV